jgi:hypothetical protein
MVGGLTVRVDAAQISIPVWRPDFLADLQAEKFRTNLKSDRIEWIVLDAHDYLPRYTRFRPCGAYWRDSRVIGVLARGKTGGTSWEYVTSYVFVKMRSR